MKIKPVEDIKALCKKIAEPLNVEIFDVEFKQGKNPALTIYLKKSGGMDMDTCEAFHNAVSEPLDAFDPTYGEPYTLNVSSAGIDWPFRTEEDFVSHIGKKVEVWLNTTIKGKKEIDGILEKYDGKSAVIKVNEKLTLSVEMKNVVKMNEFIDFE